ncbi:MAG: TIGR03936 family radical SAM-associated protein [Bacillota bacterium]
MFRYRVTFRKEGPVRWIGHLDVVRAFERALRRAALPLCYSEGFNPRPRMVFALPLPVGVLGCRELMDLYLRTPVSPEAVKARLSDAFPEGLYAGMVRRIPRNAPALMAVVNRSTYRIEGVIDCGISPEAVAAAVQAVLDAGEIKITRYGKGKVKEHDIRPGIFSFEAKCTSGRVSGVMTVKAGQQGNVRPEEVIGAFIRFGGFCTDPLDFMYYRTGLFTVTADRMISLG